MPNLETTIKTISPLQQTPEQSVVSKRSVTKRIFVGAIKVVLYVVFVIAAVYYTPKILSKQLHTQYPLATITSGSMWPVLKVNDLILMKGMTGDKAEIGQIIIYQNSKGFTIHRLVRKDGNKLITQGDANDVEDTPITESQVVGRIVYLGHSPFRIPYLGFVAKNLGPKIAELEKK